MPNFQIDVTGGPHFQFDVAKVGLIFKMDVPKVCLIFKFRTSGAHTKIAAETNFFFVFWWSHSGWPYGAGEWWHYDR